VLALRDPEHFELTLVPTNNHIDAKTALPDMVGGDGAFAAISGWKSDA
jgi:hypothetical protein